MPSIEHDSGGSAAGTQLRSFGPTPLAHAVDLAEDVRTDPNGRLRARMRFVRTSLRLLVAVMDAERRALGLPAPAALRDLVRNLHKPSMGAWSQAAAALARDLVQQDDLVFPRVPATLYVGRRQTPAATAFRKLTEARNEWAHADESPVRHGSAASMLKHIASDLRAVFDAMRVWVHVPVVSLGFGLPDISGEQEIDMLLFRGLRPEKLRWMHVGGLPPMGQALAIGRDGQALVLTPWVLVDTFGGALSEARVLVKWKPKAPVFALPGEENAAPSRAVDTPDPSTFLELYQGPRRVPDALPPDAVSTLYRANQRATVPTQGNRI